MHYYQFNIGDYAAHTRHLSMLEDLAYRRLLDLYYSSEKPIIKDIKKLSRLLSMPGHEQEIEQVLEDFFILTDDGYCQNRADEEISRYHSKADAARANGKKGGRPKKPKNNPDKTEPEPGKTQSVILANPAKTGSKAKQEPITNNQKPITNNQPKSRAFTKPEPHELIVHFESKGSDRNEAERFWNYYESNGWKVGKNPMKNWKAAAANWLKNAKPSLPASQTTGSDGRELAQIMGEVIR